MRAVVLRSALATLSDEQLITEQINSFVSQFVNSARCLRYTRHQTRQTCACRTRPPAKEVLRKRHVAYTDRFIRFKSLNRSWFLVKFTFRTDTLFCYTAGQSQRSWNVTASVWLTAGMRQQVDIMHYKECNLLLWSSLRYPWQGFFGKRFPKHWKLCIAFSSQWLWCGTLLVK